MKSNGNLSIMKLFPGIFQQKFIAGLLHTAILVVKVKHTRARFACKWKLSHRKPKKTKRNPLLICSRTLQKNMVSKSASSWWLRMVLFIDVGGYVIYSYDSSGRGRFLPVTSFTKHGIKNDCTHSTSSHAIFYPTVYNGCDSSAHNRQIGTSLESSDDEQLSCTKDLEKNIPKVFYFRRHKSGSWKRFR